MAVYVVFTAPRLSLGVRMMPAVLSRAVSLPEEGLMCALALSWGGMGVGLGAREGRGVLLITLDASCTFTCWFEFVALRKS